MTEKIEINQTSKNEIHVMDIRIEILENNIMVFYAANTPTVELANAMYEIDTKLLKEIEGKAYRIINLNKAGKPSKEAREIFQKILNENHVEKTAFVVGNSVAKIIAYFIIAFLKTENIKLFSTQESAIKWIKSI